MIRLASVVIALCAVTGLGCAEGPQEATVELAKHATFEGEWQSITPSTEFIRLSVVSKSSELGALAARLTFSGVYWDGNGRVDGDSLVADMAIAGASTPSAVLVAHVREAGRLQLRMRSATGSPLDLTMVRTN